MLLYAYARLYCGGKTVLNVQLSCDKISELGSSIVVIRFQVFYSLDTISGINPPDLCFFFLFFVWST